jgi:ribosome-binding protein aMBF1 (putative translation factor)
MKNTKSAKEIIAERYGKEGTKEREQFREDAFAFYFGEIIRGRRKELKMSQEDLALKVGKKRPYISRVENGEDIRLSNFALLAGALGLSIHVSAE